MTARTVSLPHQMNEFNAHARGRIPAELVKDLFSPVEQLIRSGATAHALTQGAPVPDFTQRLDPTVIIARLTEMADR